MTPREQLLALDDALHRLDIAEYKDCEPIYSEIEELIKTVDLRLTCDSKHAFIPGTSIPLTGVTAIHLAACYGNFHTIKQIFERDQEQIGIRDYLSDPFSTSRLANCLSETGLTPMHLCTNPLIVPLFVKNSVNFSCGRNAPALHAHCRRGNVTMVEAIIKADDCAVYHKDRNDRNALHAVCERGVNAVRIIPLLVKAGLTLFEIDDANMTPMHLAIGSRNAESVRALCDAGVYIHGRLTYVNHGPKGGWLSCPPLEKCFRDRDIEGILFLLTEVGIPFSQGCADDYSDFLTAEDIQELNTRLAARRPLPKEENRLPVEKLMNANPSLQGLFRMLPGVRAPRIQPHEPIATLIPTAKPECESLHVTGLRLRRSCQ